MPAETDRVVVEETEGAWTWRRVAANNRTLCSGDDVLDREDHAWRAAYRACPDLDPSWTLQPAPPAAVSLDAINRLLNASVDDLDAARTELLEQLP